METLCVETAYCLSNLGSEIVCCVFFFASSMYFDEDGDLAHEFYEEVRPNKRGKKSYMKKVTRRLLPQGLVELPFPRLHVDFPVVMCEAY